MDPDETFVTQAAAGSREAFNELVRRYRRRIYNLVRALTGGNSEAEDLVQDIFVRAYRAIGAFRGDSAFGSWLYRIAVNVVHSHADRQRVRDGVFPATSHDANLVDNVSGGADLEEAVLRRQIIDRALATLPEELRILIVLRDVHGLKYEEIVKIVKTPRGTVESRLFRARQRLRPMLETLISVKPPIERIAKSVTEPYEASAHRADENDS